jgi:beta-aspartyl-peptidase (threonine type)
MCGLVGRTLVLLGVVVLSQGTCWAAEPPAAKAVGWAMAIHGGAGGDPATMTPAEVAQHEQSLKAALEIGRSILAAGGTALDAVEQTVRALENDPAFNAGKGAVFNSEGRHELDASIMDGRDRSAGAVAAVRTVKNPGRGLRR